MRGCSIEWDPSGDQADKIRQAAAEGGLQPSSAGRQAASTQVTTACLPTQATSHRPDTQLTPLVHWPSQQQGQAPGMTHPAAGPGKPLGTQADEAGQHAAGPAAAVMASQAQQSQAPPAGQRQGQQRQQPGGTTAAAGNGQWLAVAKEVLSILEPTGRPRQAIIDCVKALCRDGGGHTWLAAGPAALAREVESLLS